MKNEKRKVKNESPPVLVRKTDWELKLFTAIEKNQNTLFEWGKHDCSLFAADLIKEMTGTDLAEGLRGKYASFKGSLRVIKEQGFKDLAELLDSKLGVQIPVKMAKRGDVVLLKTDKQKAAGIVAGANAVAAGVDGVVLVPMKNWLLAWRV